MKEKKKNNKFRVIGHLKNGSEFTPGQIATSEITKALVEAIGLESVVHKAVLIKGEA